MVLATRQISARPAYAVMQVSALAVGLLALVLLVRPSGLFGLPEGAR